MILLTVEIWLFFFFFVYGDTLKTTFLWHMILAALISIFNYLLTWTESPLSFYNWSSLCKIWLFLAVFLFFFILHNLSNVIVLCFFFFISSPFSFITWIRFLYLHLFYICELVLESSITLSSYKGILFALVGHFYFSFGICFILDGISWRCFY